MQSSTSPSPAPGLLRLATRLAAGPDAEDLVQSTWLRALEHAGPVHARGSWLRRVLLNEQRMKLRGEKRRDERERAASHVADAPVDVEHVVHCLEVARIIDELVDALDEPLRVVVRERYFHGETAAAIAKRHRIPAGTVRWRLKSGLDRLRGELDARYGGRRALWAGVFAPTIGPSAASPPATAAVSAATGNGASAMSMKIVLVAGVLTASVGGAAWVATERASATEEAPRERVTPYEAAVDVVAADAGERTPPREVATSREPAEAQRVRWSERLAEIRAAHGAGAGPSWQSAGAGAAPVPVGLCTPEGCIERLAEEIRGLVEGCEAFMDGAPPDLSLSATVVAAPDVGTLVESVELVSKEPTSPELHECLTESMYALDLGPTTESFEQTITVMLGTHSLADFAGGELDPQTRAKIDQAIAEHGEDAKVRVLHLAHED